MSNLDPSTNAIAPSQSTAGQPNKVDADVLGPAYAMSQPGSPLALSQDLALSLKKNLDGATTAWVTTMVNAFVATPLNQVRRLTEQLDGSLGGFLGGGLGQRRVLLDHAPGDWTPDIDVSREGQSVQVSALLPGATEGDIEVEIRDGQLLISGECNFSEDGTSSTHFRESIDLLNAVDSSSVEARIDEQGLLVISMKLQDQEAHA